MKRKIKLIVVHCTATREGEDFSAKDIDAMHKRRGWKGIGYHFLVKLNGKIEIGRPLDEAGAHAIGFNKESIGVVYTGGLDKNGKPTDTRTPKQQSGLLKLLDALTTIFPSVEKIVGHRDLSPDLNGNGIIEKHEFLKECPCFNAQDEYEFLIR